MTTKNSLFTITICLVCCLTGCAVNAPHSTDIPTDTISPELITIAREEVLETNFYQNLNLQAGEQVSIFDALGSQVLFGIYKDYTEDEMGYQETGYSSYTTRTAVYDLEQEAILYDIPFVENTLCVDAALSGTRVAFVSVGISPQETPYYDVQVFEKEATISLERGDCSLYPDCIPAVVPMGEGKFAYSFYVKGIFGVNLITASNKIIPQITLTEGGNTCNITTILRGNEKSYLYFAEVDGQPTFFVGTDERVEHQFVLPENERYYSYCLLADGIVFSSTVFESAENNSGTNCLIMRELSGTVIEQVDSPTFYRLASNGKDKLLGIDSSYTQYFISLDDDIQYRKIESTKATPALFYGLDTNQFLLHYNDSSKADGVRLEVLTTE